jgi:hypothetical protein
MPIRKREVSLTLSLSLTLTLKICNSSYLVSFQRSTCRTPHLALMMLCRAVLVTIDKKTMKWKRSERGTRNFKHQNQPKTEETEIQKLDCRWEVVRMVDRMSS